MNDINIDRDEITSDEPVNLNKSARIYRINGRLLLVSFILSAFVKPFFKQLAGLFDLLIGLPIIVIVFLAPVGLFFCWRSYRKKEGTTKMRIKHLLIHAFFNILTVLFISGMVMALLKLVQK